MADSPYNRGYDSADDARIALINLGIPISMLASTETIPLFFRDHPGLCLVYMREGQVYFTTPAEEAASTHLRSRNIETRNILEGLITGSSGVIDDITATGVGLEVAHTDDGTSIDILDNLGKLIVQIRYSQTRGRAYQTLLAENIPDPVKQIGNTIEALLNETKDAYHEGLNPLFDAARS